MTVMPVSVSPEVMAAWIGAAPRWRGKRDACRFKQAIAWDFQNRRGQDLPVSHHDNDIRFVRADRFHRFSALDPFRLKNRDR